MTTILFLRVILMSYSVMPVLKDGRVWENSGLILPVWTGLCRTMHCSCLLYTSALAAGEFGRDICLGSGNVTCSTGEKVECVIRPFGLD